jgi:hypothetical protein
MAAPNISGAGLAGQLAADLPPVNTLDMVGEQAVCSGGASVNLPAFRPVKQKK